MRARQRGDVKRVEDTRDIKRAPIERSQQADVVEQMQEVVQVLMLDKRPQFATMPARDYRDRRIVLEAHRLDVEERHVVKKLGNDAPFIERREPVNEEPDVFDLERCKATFALFDERSGQGDRQPLRGDDIAPRTDASFVKLCQPHGSNPGAMQECFGNQ